MIGGVGGCKEMYVCACIGVFFSFFLSGTRLGNGLMCVMIGLSFFNLHDCGSLLCIFF